MSNRMRRVFLTAVAAFLASSVHFASAQEKAEGKVVGTKLTACDFQNGRCEGFLDLQTGADSKNTTRIRVVSDTAIRKGNEKALLPSLRGKVVAVSYVADKGEKVAKAIDVLPGTK